MEKRLLEELSIEVTMECNLACIHCSSGSVPKKSPNELIHEEHSRLIVEARELGASVLSLSGGNPLLCEHVVSLVDEAFALGYERVLMYTTGHCLHGHAAKQSFGRVVYQHERINDLVGKGVTWIFSLHSHLDDVNDMLMGTEGALFDIKDSIHWLTKHGERVEVHCVPMIPNWEHLRGVRKLAGELGASKVSFLRFVPQTRGSLNRGKLLMSHAEFVSMQYMLNEMVNEPGVEIRMGCPIDFRHTIADMGGKVRYCHAGDDLILVRPTGNVHPCAAWKSLPVDSNVRNSSLADIWENSDVFRSIREFKDGGFHKVENGCAKCGFVESCMSGCPAQRLHHIASQDMQDLYAPITDPMCPIGGEHE